MPNESGKIIWPPEKTVKYTLSLGEQVIEIPVEDSKTQESKDRSE